KRRDHVDRGLGALLLVGPTRGLSVDGDHPLWCPSQRRNPGNEAALEVLGVKRREDIAEVIVRRRAIAKWPEPAQEIELLGTETGDVDEGLRPGQYREQTQQQHCVEWIGHLPALPRVRHVPEIPQKNNRLGKRLTVRCNAVHRCPPRIDPEDHQRFSTSAVCHAIPSPDCPDLTTTPPCPTRQRSLEARTPRQVTRVFP